MQLAIRLTERRKLIRDYSMAEKRGVA